MSLDSEIHANQGEKDIVPDKLKELGYYLHPDWRGKGIIKSGVKAALAYAETEFGVQKVVVQIAEDNLNSRRVIESMGDYFVRLEGRDNFG